MKAKPTESELAILQVLWGRGPSTVREVNDELSLQREVGYTTTLKLLQIMFEKGIVQRDESSRSHVYAAAISREATRQDMVDHMLESAFGGSAAQLVMQALGNHAASAEELAQIRAYLDQLENKA
ncbi:MAG: BlaI/MecI/CopY family transcriptional regulator [Bacteroidia bacterium]|nr:BlaI/MecI/CopY family transcriptional regulator [Bacteroidia bacterium]